MNTRDHHILILLNNARTALDDAVKLATAEDNPRRLPLATRLRKMENDLDLEQDRLYY